MAVGKRIGRVLYVHSYGLAELPDTLVNGMRRAEKIAGVTSAEWNVAKIKDSGSRYISLLAYDDFETTAFPRLRESWWVDLRTAHVGHRSYRKSSNPPILHRKELLIPSRHPLVQRFAQLTMELERLDLYRDAYMIGYEKQWVERLKKAGVQIEGHEVRELSSG